MKMNMIRKRLKQKIMKKYYLNPPPSYLIMRKDILTHTAMGVKREVGSGGGGNPQ